MRPDDHSLEAGKGLAGAADERDPFPAEALEALAVAAQEADPGSLGAATRLRGRFDAEVAAWALSQESLRRKARAKFAAADRMLFTPAGLEQGTRDRVRRWRAGHFREAGVREVWDLGCGIGADAMAFAEAGLAVVGVEADAATAEVARHNLSVVGMRASGEQASTGGDALVPDAETVIVGRAEDLAPPAEAAIFLDPARRTSRGRTWNVADFTPPWSLVLDYLASDRFVCVKLGPGLPKELIPDGVHACWVSDGGDVVEVSLWNRWEQGHSAVLLGDGATHSLRRDTGQAAVELPVGALGRYVYEPDGAVIRSGLIGEAFAGTDARLLDGQVAYVTADEVIDTPYATCFEVRDVLDYNLKTLKAYVRDRRLGTVEIKKRAIDVDPAQLRRQLKPSGPESATLILARTVDGTKAIIATRQR